MQVRLERRHGWSGPARRPWPALRRTGSGGFLCTSYCAQLVLRPGQRLFLPFPLPLTLHGVNVGHVSLGTVSPGTQLTGH